MTTPNGQSGGLDAESGLPDVNHGGAANDRSGDAGQRDSRLDKSYWFNYLMIGAGLATLSGIIILIWGSAQNGQVAMLVGAGLLAAGTLGWVAALVILTWLLIREIWPPIWRKLYGLRQNIPNFNPKIQKK